MAGYPTKTIKGMDIPYDPYTGHVPKELLASRFLAKSQNPYRDCTRKARGTLEGPTPEEAANWWDDPSVCDIVGIDDCEELFELRKLMHPEAQRRIAVLTNSRTAQETIRKDLERAFSSEELKRMSSYLEEAPGLTVDARKRDKKLRGSCDFRTGNRPGNMISVSDDAVGDGITTVHEGVHLIRHAEGRSENRDPTGRTNSAAGQMIDFLRRRGGAGTRFREETETSEEAAARIGRKPTLVLIDESGDPSHSPGSSKEFVMVATIKEDDGQFERIADETPKYTRRSRRDGEKDELKYSSSSDEVREDVLKRIEATDARIHVVRVPKEGVGKSPERLYGNVTKEILKSTLSDEKVRGNPKGAKVILDDSRYASRLDVKKTIESAAEDRGVAVDEGSGTRRSHECKPLQVNDFPTGAYGTEYNAGDSKYSDIVRGKSIVRIFHRK